MTRLRTLGGVVLVAGIFAGLTSCANQKGDLGAEREETVPAEHPTPSEPSAPVGGEVVDLNSTAPKTTTVASPITAGDATPIPITARPSVVETKADGDKPVEQPAPAPEVPIPAKPINNTTEAAKPINVTEAKADENKPAEQPAPVTAPVAEVVAIPNATENSANSADALAKLKAAQEKNSELESQVGQTKARKVLAQMGLETKADGDKPAPPAAPPAPAEETAEQRAARLLIEAEKHASVATQAELQESEASYQTGLKLFNDLEYEESVKYFERAVALNPANSAAVEKLNTVRGLLGIHVNSIKAQIIELEHAERVKMQEAMISIAQAIQEARTLEQRGSANPVEIDSGDKERALSDELENLRRAQDRYRRVKEIINWMPPNLELPGLRTQVDEGLSRVRQRIAEKDDEISFLRRVQAQRAIDETRSRESELFREKIKKLLEQVKDLYDRNDFKSAERLSIRILQIDPLNTEAENWKSKARGAFHSSEQASTENLRKEETRRSWEDVDESQISYAQTIKYPSNWDQITRRSDAASIGKTVREEAWKTDINKKLQRKVTFEFVDTPLEEAINFLRGLAGVTMIVDPRVLANNPPPINLRVTDMSLNLALDWILRLAELEYALKDNAIFVSKADKLQAEAELRIYDVSDLTSNVPDFPGPEFQIQVGVDKGGAGAGGGAAAAFTKPPDTTPTLTNIADMIRNRVRPESWDATLGTSIEERGGRLVVMQRPEIHALVVQLLSNFRATQKMMINIEARFLTIREAYLEDTGVEFQGLDPNVLTGDFGDIRNLGAPTGFVQPRVPGGTDATPPNVPFPGVVSPVENVLGGSFSQVGSITNHQINFFNNDPDTISGNDTSNTIRQGGFSGQVSILNNTQMQAFIRALAVHENQSTLIAPRLTVFNTQRANMFVARQQAYISDYEISGDAYQPIVRQFLVGVVLDVKPIVSSDRRYVTLELRPTVTALVNFETRQIDAFQVNQGATFNLLVLLSFPIQFPELSITKVRTTATVPDGGILLLGGLYRNIKFNAENGVPFLSDLPVIGRLFRWNVVDNAKSNLSILVSPRIILFNEEEEKLLEFGGTQEPSLYSGKRRTVEKKTVVEKSVSDKCVDPAAMSSKDSAPLASPVK